MKSRALTKPGYTGLDGLSLYPLSQNEVIVPPLAGIESDEVRSVCIILRSIIMYPILHRYGTLARAGPPTAMMPTRIYFPGLSGPDAGHFRDRRPG